MIDNHIKITYLIMKSTTFKSLLLLSVLLFVQITCLADTVLLLTKEKYD